MVDCDIDAYIPASYIKNEYQKLDIYKRISGIENQEEYMDMQDELIDRFGDIPKPVENLLLIAQIKAMAHQAGVTEVNINRQEITLRMYKNAGIDTTGIPADRPVQGGVCFQDRGSPHLYLSGSQSKKQGLHGNDRKSGGNIGRTGQDGGQGVRVRR